MHSFLTHTFVAILLFVLSLFVFDGGGIYSILVTTGAEATGNLLTAEDDFSGAADRLEALIPRIVAFIASLVLYYVAAAIVLGVLRLIRKN